MFAHLMLNHSKHTIVICDKVPIGNEYIFSSGSVGVMYFDFPRQQWEPKSRFC